MRITYYDKSKRRMRSIYIKPGDNRSGRMLAIIASKPISLHPLDLLQSLVSTMVGIILLTVLKPRPSTRKSEYRIAQLRSEFMWSNPIVYRLFRLLNPKYTAKMWLADRRL